MEPINNKRILIITTFTYERLNKNKEYQGQPKKVGKAEKILVNEDNKEKTLTPIKLESLLNSK